jgi:DNA-binding IclR family transcriptional regulator
MEIDELLEQEDRAMPNGEPVDIPAFVAECHAAKGRPLAMTVGMINSFTQCLAAPITSHNGLVAATICFVIPIDISGEKRSALESRLIEASKAISLTNYAVSVA